MSRVVSIARTWIGTPYVHQASARGAGTDCLGLVRGVWRELYGAEPQAVPPYTQDWAEPQGDEVLHAAADRHLTRLTASCPMRPGDLLLFRMREGSIAKHLGLVGRIGAVPTFIHAYSGHGVLESPLSTPWMRRIAARFRFPETISEEG
ncbi:NlpC/P60 family protein [Jannaschia sp. S6380]|uniref:NlpC/P60 family protein n=1 Tax=Jannaschia sp. S6380 TaxID=2926408 RepID=UPI001FF244AE|nr:NlpC/P60 family protein [Jannaschia sp. S6380]MCK0166884.1 NlpC/P60 family protein [Jannaschia sp. S6380]